MGAGFTKETEARILRATRWIEQNMASLLGRRGRMPYGSGHTKVIFSTHTSITSYYLGYTMSGTPAGPFPQGLTQGSQVYIQNLNEFALIGKWPTPVGDPGTGYNDGSFTDPATQVTLPLITVDHPSRGPC